MNAIPLSHMINTATSSRTSIMVFKVHLLSNVSRLYRAVGIGSELTHLPGSRTSPPKISPQSVNPLSGWQHKSPVAKLQLRQSARSTTLGNQMV